ncbi:UNVERIFIED_CONTAM: hypothetical protein Sindi_2616200 [Sesamum indicum]
MATAEYNNSPENGATSRGIPDPEFMQLQSLDHPGMVMVSALLTGSNYFAWSRAVKRALTAKMKIDFIDGSAIRPPVNTDEFKRLNRIDSMVTTWILNCMTKDLAESFMYVGSARELWVELEARYGESNSPLIYQLQREIGEVTQGNMSVTEYYTKLKRLWDELMCLAPMPKCVCTNCTCEVNKSMADMVASNQLIQFLVGLNSVYDQARSQILLLEPLPTVTKAYSMLIRMEKQMNLGSMENNGGAAFQVKGQSYKKKPVTDKRHMICDHCQKPGHTKDSCFKLHGIPDWYKEMGEQRRKVMGKGRGYNAMTSEDSSRRSVEGNHSNITELIKQEMKKFMLEETPTDLLQVNFAQLDNFAGSCDNSTSLISCTWIIDSGATNNICADARLFCSYTKHSDTIVIHLPNGHSQTVTHIGSIQLTPNIKLTHVVHIPAFSVNLLSVRQLCASSSIQFNFLTSTCIMQDLETRNILAIAHLKRNLYILECSIMSLRSNYSSFSCTVNLNQFTLWHQRLGHLSNNSMKHITKLSQLDCALKPCEICPLAKMYKLPFDSSKTRTTSAFSLVHLDIWGPYREATMNGCHYFLTIVDDFTRTTWTFFMKYKNQALEMF